MPSSVLQVRHSIRNTNLFTTSTPQTTQMLCKACFQRLLLFYIIFFVCVKIRQDPFLKLKQPEHDLGTPIWSQFDWISNTV